MNYRHAYHAGGFADVFKHILLSRIIEYLKRKDGAFRVVDTHAGAGIYDLAGVESGKTGEWIGGIARLLDAEIPQHVEDLLQPYLSVVREGMQNGVLTTYPGSPLVTRRLLRKQDRLSGFELHEADAAQLAALFAGDFQTRIARLDGWLVPGAHLPPKEKRGMVLIDPPFEKEGEFDRMLKATGQAHRRWPNGTIALWYPLKHETAVAKFKAALRQSGMPKLLCLEFWRHPAGKDEALRGSGLIVKNPPFVLEDEARAILPFLAETLAPDSRGGWSANSLGERDR